MFNLDQLIIEGDRALRILTGAVQLNRPVPKPAQAEMETGDQPAISSVAATLTEAEKKHAAGLMRVNHVGEVCAQALYQAQRLTSSSTHLQTQLAHAAKEEEDHLVWCANRLEELGSRPSLLNPLWFAGSFAIGTLAGLAGDQWSLGFVVETEKQVENHLNSHLEALPAADILSRSIVEQMRVEEIEHGNMARHLGAKDLPEPIKKVMGAVSQLMTKTAYYL
ncbi:2-polyprenyl-3-methyl-6-methoxy-1,4-benzoquinone monooxygenase [Polynucleobacter kasalickyi]|uniref:3-demethoxyubiquinol 3-hydroxylase n=1 Tax=Polynucleobacter kasalickyi TaxID=1938817 RepID=A0A1W2AEH5_9BURK|nr:2-polyprenyl-3-methyl-6-methoxy-1,4-benzoquinone monooxygenase [Polynucleobacter kasalickyi]SMC59087.1 ubiquinone biosynthesis monooxygenase Coq7 [Polynucleobacter kasalickyi]